MFRASAWASHRSFNVDSPINTSIIVMIQERTGWFWLRPLRRENAPRPDLLRKSASAQTTLSFAFRFI